MIKSLELIPLQDEFTQPDPPHDPAPHELQSVPSALSSGSPKTRS